MLEMSIYVTIVLTLAGAVTGVMAYTQNPWFAGANTIDTAKYSTVDYNNMSEQEKAAIPDPQKMISDGGLTQGFSLSYMLSSLTHVLLSVPDILNDLFYVHNPDYVADSNNQDPTPSQGNLLYPFILPFAIGIYAIYIIGWFQIIRGVILKYAW